MMTKRVFIVHGWGGSPDGDWYPWVKKELEEQGFNVEVPAMPDTEEPVIEKWVSFLNKKVGTPDVNTFFVGHSIGCQTIIRYLETLHPSVIVGGAVFVAGWTKLNMKKIREEEVEDIAKPWLETSIQWALVNEHLKNSVAIFSDNDYYVPLEEKNVFEENLNSKTIVLKNKGHFTASDDVTELPVVLDELLELVKETKRHPI